MIVTKKFTGVISMHSEIKLLRRKVCQQINRAAKEAKPRSQYTNGYLAALARVVHLIDKIESADDYDEHRVSGLIEEE